jgi:hypothetical protein
MLTYRSHCIVATVRASYSESPSFNTMAEDQISGLKFNSVKLRYYHILFELNTWKLKYLKHLKHEVDIN